MYIIYIYTPRYVRCASNYNGNFHCVKKNFICIH